MPEKCKGLGTISHADVVFNHCGHHYFSQIGFCLTSFAHRLEVSKDAGLAEAAQGNGLALDFGRDAGFGAENKRRPDLNAGRTEAEGFGEPAGLAMTASQPETPTPMPPWMVRGCDISSAYLSLQTMRALSRS